MDMKHTRHWLTMVVWLLCSITASAETVASGTCGDNLTWTLTDEGELIIEGTGAMTDYSQTDSAPWHGYKSLINDVIVKEGVISIGDYAFFECYKSTAITIPESVTSIGDFVFRICNSLASITIPNGVTSIGDQAFYFCSNLTTITIPESVTSIGYLAFSHCSSLTSITLPEGVTSIGAGAFINCSSLTSIIVEKGNTVYDSRNSCNAIIESETNTLIVGCSNTIIPEGVTSIGDYAFEGCSNLTTITIPEGVTSIGYDAFDNCSNLTSINIPNGVTSIGEDAFSKCTNLASITIPESVTSIGYLAFSNCSSLTSITVAEGNPIYDSREGCNAIIETSTNTLITGCSTTVIPTSMTSIGEDAFSKCTNLASITIPESVTSIGSWAFYSCNSLTSITCKATNPPTLGNSAFYEVDMSILVYVPASSVAAYQAADGWSEFTNIRSYIASGTCGENLTWTLTDEGELIIEGTGAMTNYENAKATPWYDYNSLINDVTIKEGMTSIGNSAFYGCSSLTTITIPESVTSIGNSAFDGCINLTSITIPEGVTSIGRWAFGGCSSLTTITIPEGVTSIEDYTFWVCRSLTSITIPESVTSIGNSAFFDCRSLTSITIPEDVTSIGERAFGDCSNLTSITILSSVTSIEKHAFEGCSSLTAVHICDISAWCNIKFSNSTSNPLSYAHNLYLNGELVTNLLIPEDVTSIGEYAFFGCTSLTTITISEGVTRIEDYAFRGCSSLTAITIPSSVTSIRTWAFYGCSSTTTITVAERNTVYDSRGGCNAIIETASNTLIIGCATTIIPESVTSIGYDAFYECRSLTAITIPESVTSIGEWAFGGCSSLTAINIPENSRLTSIENATFCYCSSLTTITIPESVTSIGVAAFNDCSSLTSITIPEGVTNIGDQAFFGCSGLTSINIPEKVTSIGEWAFSDCDNLTSVTVKNTVPVALTNGYVFSNRANATLYVPAGSKEAYASAAVWSEFKEIVEVGNAFVLDDATLRAGRSALLPVALTNENETTAFQCDIYLPEGITLLKTDKGKYDITLAEERKDDHTVTSSLQNDGAIRVVVASLTSSLFAGNSGDLFYLNLQADEDISGELPLSIKNIRISESDGTRHDLNDASCVINVPAFTPADANNDGLVAIDDVVLTINYLLGDVSDSFLFVAGDMNADNQILIDDVVQIINCLLGVGTADVQAARSRMRETGEALTAGDTQCGFGVKLSNASNYVALQCDVLLPTGVSIDDVRVTSGGDHSVVFREMGDGLVRIAVTSLTNEAFASDNLLDVAVSADRQADIYITNAYAVTRGGVMVKAADASLTHGTTGIQPAGMKAISTEIYDLNGRVVKENATSTEGLQKGIYLMNGKKIVVK